MLSYRHCFHAGNAADVIKHLVLSFCIKYLTQKEKPLLCVDTHAGAGSYSVSEGVEWHNGIGRLLELRRVNGNAPFPPYVNDYLDLVYDDQKEPHIQQGSPVIHGSPLVMGKLLRSKDRLVCFELHPKDYTALERNMETFRINFAHNAPSIETREADGPNELKSLLPPPGRRGLVFIDPPWEEKDEYESIPRYAAAAIKRFPEGTYIIWYPLLSKPKAPIHGHDQTGNILFDLYSGNRCRVELFDPSAESGSHSPRGMKGSGLVVFNPPWTLKAALNELLPFLAKTLLNSGVWNLDWIDSN